MMFKFRVSGWTNTQVVIGASQETAFEEASSMAGGSGNISSWSAIDKAEYDRIILSW